MASGKDAGFRLVVEGEKDFKAALKAIDDQIKVNKAELRLLTEEYKANDNGIDGLVSKQAKLEEVLAAQAGKTQTIAERYAELSEAYGENDSRVQQLYKSLVDATAAETKMRAEVEANQRAIDAQWEAMERANEEMEYTARVLGDTAGEIGDIRQAYDALESELSANAAELRNLAAEYERADKAGGDFGDRADNLRKQNDILTDSIDAQQRKIGLLNAEMKEAVDRYGAGSKEVNEYREKIAQASGDLAEMTAQVDRNTDTIESGGKISLDSLKGIGDMLGVQLPGNLDDMIGKVGDLSGSFKGLAGVAGSVGAGLGISKAVIDSITGAAEGMDQLKESAQLLGLDTTEYQKLEYALSTVGVSADELTELFNPLYSKIRETDEIIGEFAGDTGKLQYASAETRKEVVEAMNEWTSFGVALYDAEGNLRSSVDIFYDLLDVYSSYTNKTEAMTEMQKIFGESANNLMPILETNGTYLRELGDAAERSGLIMDEYLVNALDRVNTRMDFVKTSLGNAKDALGGFLMGLLTLDGEMMGDSLSVAWNSLTSIFKKPQYATGTYSHPGGLAIVGERGPELVQLPQYSRVYPNGQGPESFGGTTNVFNVSLNARDVKEFNDFIRLTERERQSARMGFTGRK